MFAYCGNNPVTRKDITGKKYTSVLSECNWGDPGCDGDHDRDGDIDDWDAYGNPHNLPTVYMDHSIPTLFDFVFETKYLYEYFDYQYKMELSKTKDPQKIKSLKFWRAFSPVGKSEARRDALAFGIAGAAEGAIRGGIPMAMLDAAIGAMIGYATYFIDATVEYLS